MPSDNQELMSGLHLWTDSVDTVAGLDDALGILSHDERARARRFHFERDYVRFVARRAFARKVLADYVGVAPSEIRMRTSGHGKPELDPPCGVFFNASHSDGLAIIAVVSERLVGVDIERVRPLPDALEVADGFFSCGEIDLLRATPEDSRAEAFLTIWTRKESYVKAVGAGLSVPFDRFDVSTLDDGGIGRAHGHRADPRFAFAGLEHLDGYVGAVTLSGRGVMPQHVSAS